MSQYWKLTVFHMKRIFKDPKTLLLIILPVALSFFLSMVFNSDTSPTQGNHAFISQSRYFDQEIYPQLSENSQADMLTNRDQADALLDEGQVDVVYELGEDYEKSGHFKGLSLNGQTHNQYVEEEITRIWQKAQEHQIYSDYGIELGDSQAPEIALDQEKDFLPIGLMISLFMIFYMMYINASMFSTDLLEMRENFILKRSIVSRSSGKAILGSVLSAYGLIFLVMNIIAFAMVMIFNEMPIKFLSLIIAYLFVNVAFTVAYILVMVRIFKKKELLSSISMGIAILFVVIPQVIRDTAFESLSMLSPFHWTMEGLDYASFFPQGLVILLMAVALFTAGSFKVEELAKV